MEAQHNVGLTKNTVVATLTGMLPPRARDLQIDHAECRIRFSEYQNRGTDTPEFHRVRKQMVDVERTIRANSHCGSPWEKRNERSHAPISTSKFPLDAQSPHHKRQHPLRSDWLGHNHSPVGLARSSALGCGEDTCKTRSDTEARDEEPCVRGGTE